MKGIELWYDGHRVIDSNRRIYNAWSIVNYLKSKQLKTYWAEPDYFLNLEGVCFHDTIYHKIMSTLLPGFTEVKIIEKLSVKHVFHLIDLT